MTAPQINAMERPRPQKRVTKTYSRKEREKKDLIEDTKPREALGEFVNEGCPASTRQLQTSPTTANESTSTPTKKRTISDWFKPAALPSSSSPSAPESRDFSPILSSPATQPSSPPPQQRKEAYTHKRRRLNTRPIYFNQTAKMSRLSAVDVSDMDIDIDELVDARLAKATAEALENTHPLLTGGSRRRLRRTNAYTSFTADETDDNDIVPPNTPVDSDRPAPEDAPNQKQAAMTAFEHNIEDETNTDEVDTVRRLTTSINSDKPRDTPTVSDYDSQREDESGYASEAPQPPRIASQIIVEHSAPIGIPTAAPNSAHATIQSAAENAVQSAVQNGARSAAQNANQNFVIHHVAIPAPPNLVQATLNFGQNTAPTTCNTCGFVYMRNLHDEVRGHNEFHADFIGPVAVTKRIFNENASGVKTQEYSRSVENEFGELDDKSYFIGTINLKARKYYRETAEKVVDKIEKGLENDMSYEVADYECLKSADLWSKIKDPLATKNARQVPRFKVFIVIEKKLIISAAVVELITQSTSATFTPCTVDGYTVDSTHDIDGNPHTIMGEDMVDVKMTFDDPYKWEKAHVGVHYLWTHEDYRRCGHAARLMDFVRRKGFGTHILKEDVAYTQLNRDLKEFLLKYNTGHTDWNLVEWSVRLYDSEVKDEKLYV